MAKQKPNIMSGQIANIIFYEFRGIQCSRSRPRRMPRTEASKISAQKFGIASRLGSMLRLGLTSLLPDPADKKMMYRLNNVLAHWLRASNPGENTAMTNIPFISQFQFNPESELDVRIKQGLNVIWTEPGRIILDIPELDPVKDIAAPAWTQTVKWKIAAVRCEVKNRPELSISRKAEIDMPYNEGIQPARQIELPVTPMAGEITLVVVALRYYSTRNGELQVVEEKRWLPAGIVGACYGEQAG